MRSRAAVRAMNMALQSLREELWHQPKGRETTGARPAGKVGAAVLECIERPWRWL